MISTIRLLAGGLPGLAEPATPESLASAHPSWARDIAALGPWTLVGEFWLPALAPAPGGPEVLVCGPCASTMDVARELVASERLCEWGSVVAPVQSQGRGQLRRGWLSAPGNLFATLALPPAQGAWNDLRPLVLGALLASALDNDTGAVRVKWPNDLLFEGRKVGGMLIEERPGSILAGFGLNLAWAPGPEVLREEHAVEAGIFSPANSAVGPLRLWCSLVNHVKTGYVNFLDACTPTEFLTIFNSRLAWAGRRVLVREGAGVRYEARIVGVSDKGELVLEHSGRRVCLCAGDVTPL